MIKHRQYSQGFTAVELLVTLFVAAAFLIAGYQLFNIVIKDGGDARAQSRASNTAYQYMRQYSDTATNPCTSVAPIVDQPATVEGLSDVSVSVVVDCAQEDAPSLSKVEVIVKYGSPQKSLEHTTYIDKSKGAGTQTDVTGSLVAWWKLNGNANSDAGSYNGTVFGATPTADRNGVANKAYSFNGTNNYIQVPTGLSSFPAGLTISFWANPTSNGSYARFIDFGSGTTNSIVVARMGTSNEIYQTHLNSAGATIAVVGAANGIVNNQWRHYAIVTNASGGMTIYINGSPSSSASGQGQPVNATRTSNYIGRSNWNGDAYYQGAMDDIRIYSRAISASEVLQIWNGGPK